MAVFGFIGLGNMGGALARAAGKKLSGPALLLSNRSREKALRLAEELNAQPSDNLSIAENADYIFLGVKPQMLSALLAELAPVFRSRRSPFVLVSMAAGTDIQAVQGMAGGSYPVLRIMPNTPAAIGQGMLLYSTSRNVEPAALEVFLDSMSGAGRFLRLEERLIDAASAVSGCGPAFVDIFLEALADGAVACGLPRAAARELAAQMVLGSAALALSSPEHTASLKDAVCSPGGTTIQGLRLLEQKGFRSAVIEAVIAAYEKNFDLK